jgi:hypothetical protein
MPHDPVLVAETKDWFAKAANDLRAAEHEFTAVPPLLSDIVFPLPAGRGEGDEGLSHLAQHPFFQDPQP